MRINNNLMAMNTHRQLGISTNSGAKSMEKLSSGFRINRAGDDAAGLAISEKMRGQIRGLTQASRNAQDGISLIQTAEGALNETHAILQRMRELAVQSSTDTNTDDDRKEIQKEIDQLATEITRISETTQFNTMNLLDSTYEDKKFHIGANEAQNTTIAIADMSAKALKVAGNGGPLEEVETGEYLGVEAEVLQTLVEEGEEPVVVGVKIDGDWYAAADVIKTSEGELAVAEGTEELKFEEDIAVDGKFGNYTIEEEIKIGDNGQVDETDGVETRVLKDASGEIIAVEMEDSGENAWFAVGDVKFTAADGSDPATIEPKTDAVALEVDENAKYIEQSEGGINVSTQTSADKAITVINDAISTVSSERSKLGAMQNRLEHTIKNLDTSAENLQASEARIRDVDMAKEIMEFTKQNILQQAATAMLAQANMAPQSVLQLLG